MVPVDWRQERDWKLRGGTRARCRAPRRPPAAPPFSRFKLWIPDQLCSFILDTSCAANPQITLFFAVKISKVLIINMDELWELGLMLGFLLFSPNSQPVELLTLHKQQQLEARRNGAFTIHNLIATPHRQSIPCLGSQFQGSLRRNPSGRADIVELSASRARLFTCRDLHKACFCFPVTFFLLFFSFQTILKIRLY